MNVSVIIPALNAAGTLAETLESLRAQTFPHWEAIVVDDGSSDETATIATDLAKQDAQIRVVSGPQRGVSAARNTGISLARFDWLLFLDADDWILPPLLERLTAVLVTRPELDVVHCGWTRITPTGEQFDPEFWNPSDHPFAASVLTCPLAIHACIIRKSLVEAVCCFDPSLPTCEDWDLWQRLARAGARFGAVREALAYYRIRPDSASLDGPRIFTDSLRVVIQGHRPDPRVPQPKPAYVAGLPAEQLPGAKLYATCWPAGLMIGRGQDASSLLNLLKEAHDPNLDPAWIAHTIFTAIPLSRCQTRTAWSELWSEFEQPLLTFLLALEEQAQAWELARRTRLILERLILNHSVTPRPLTLGLTHGVRIDITHPLANILPPAGVERLHCLVEAEGQPIGALELPVCDGWVSAYVLADAIAAELAWPILGRFFEQTIYPQLKVERKPGGVSLWRGNLCLAEGLPEDEDLLGAQIHDRIGWTLFLQELWDRPEWPGEYFYNAQTAPAEPALVQHRASEGWLVVEASQDLPEVEVSTPELEIGLLVGGVLLGVVTILTSQQRLEAQALRVILTTTGGLELCRACVREGLLGQPLTGGAALRPRLAAAAAARHEPGKRAGELPVNLTLKADGGFVGAVVVPTLAFGGNQALLQALPSGQPGLVFGRYAGCPMGTSASRRAMLPLAASPELIKLASQVGEPVIQVPPTEQPERALYMPELTWLPSQPRPLPQRTKVLSFSRPTDLTSYDRSHFERLFATQPDPWKYTSAYEQTKYEQTLTLLPDIQLGQALELACAEGHFTVQLASRVSSLTAADISQLALERAAEQCANLAHVRFIQLDLAKDPLPGRFGLIVCSEMLYFMGSRERLQAVAQKIAEALEPGGYFLTAHANLVVDEPDRPGFDWDFPFGAKVIGETFAAIPSLRLVKELWTPLYRIQLFQRDPRLRLLFRRSAPERIELAQQPTPLLPEVAAHVLWHGGQPRRNGAFHPVVTDQLPILMYHRVAPAGSPALTRWRITPTVFEEQLQYLRDTGFYSVTLAEWQAAQALKKPFPGRAILITFDDGYLDFLTHAWPLLKHYGFAATVFLVADKIGQSNSWDHFYGEKVALLDWPELRQLQDEGVEFGSHSANHYPLTGLSLAEIVREGARSRTILEHGLGRAIRAFAYPYGDTDPVVQHLIGACGYTFGLSCRFGRSRFQDPLLALPRLEITGFDGLQEFVTKVGA